MSANENQIVVYQPNETVRLDVRLENETVWLTQSQMATLFGCSTDNIGLHLKNVYSCGELDKEATTEESSVVQIEGRRKVSRKVCLYNLDAIISVGYRVNSVLGVRFRQWATPEMLDLFVKKRKGVKVTIFTSEHYDKKHVPHRKISDADIKTFNAQYPKLAVHYNESFHDRFLIIDDKELYVIGASLKDLGKKCFAFTKLDAGEIRRIKKSAFG